MAVAFDAAATADVLTNAGTSLTNNNLTVGASLSNGALVAMVAFANGSVPTSLALTWNGVAMTLIPNTTLLAGSGGTATVTALYGLLNPASGNKSLVATWTGTQEGNLHGLSYSGVDQTSVAVAFPHGTSATGTSTAPSVAITSAVGNATVAVFATRVAGNINSVNQTGIGFIDNTGTAMDAAGNRAAGAASNTHSAVLSLSGVWGVSGCDILAASGAADVLAAQIWL